MVVEQKALEMLKQNPGQPFCFDCLGLKASITAPGDKVWLRALWDSKWATHIKHDICSVCKKLAPTVQHH